MPAAATTENKTPRHRPKALTVFAAAFVAGAAAAVGINRALDAHLAQKRPQVESEPIFVALRSLPQGSPVTVWDVALRDWPKAMLPTTAMRANDSFEGLVLRHPLREGQPLLTVQLVRSGAPTTAAQAVPGTTWSPPAAPVARAVEADLWTPAAAASPPVSTVVPPVALSVRHDPSPAVAPPLATAPAIEPRADSMAANPSPTATSSAAPAAVVARSEPTDIEAAAAVAAGDPRADADGEPMPVVAEPVIMAADPTAAATPGLVTAAATPPDAAPFVAADEPTLADPVPGEPTPADTPPPADVAVQSVIAPQSVTTGGSAAPLAITTSQDSLSSAAAAATAADASAPTPDVATGPTRYLVVPERIALQVDSGFAPPPPPRDDVRTAASAPVRPDVRNLPAAAATSARRTTAAQPATAQGTPRQPRSTRQAAPARQPQRKPPPASASRQAAPKRSAQPPAATAPAASHSQRGKGGWFPNIAAGIDAITGGTRQNRVAETGFDEAVATDDPTYQAAPARP